MRSPTSLRNNIPSLCASFSNAISVPGRRQTATVGLSGLAKPRVVVDWNLVDTSVSATSAGRLVLRRDDLRPQASCNRTWSAPANSYPAIHETFVDPFGCYPGKKG